MICKIIKINFSIFLCIIFCCLTACQDSDSNDVVREINDGKTVDSNDEDNEEIDDGTGNTLFKNGLVPIRDFEGKCFYINKKGNKKIEGNFSWVGPFSEGLAPVSDASNNTKKVTDI